MAQIIPGFRVIESVKVLSDSNINVSTGLTNGITVDGVLLSTGDRIFLKDQISGAENGVYEIQTSGVGYRTYDAEVGDFIGGLTITVNEGTLYKDTRWICTNNSPNDIIGTDNLIFNQISGNGVDGNVNSVESSSVANQVVVFNGTDGTTVKKTTLTVDANNNVGDLGYLQLADIAAPSNPANGQGRIYKKTGSDKLFYKPDSAGAEVDLVGVEDASNVGVGGVDVFKQKNVNTLEFKSINSGSSKLTVTNDAANDNVDLDISEANVDHDALLNFVANEHVDHSGVIITAGEGLSGGGDITISRTLQFNINGLSLDSTPDTNADFLATYDTSAAGHRKITIQSINELATLAGLSDTTITSPVNQDLLMYDGGDWENKTVEDAVLGGGANSVEVGSSASAGGSNSTALGPSTSADATNATALGNGATADFADSLALGSGATVTQSGELSIGLGTNSLTTTLSPESTTARTKLVAWLPVTINGTTYYIGLHQT